MPRNRTFLLSAMLLAVVSTQPAQACSWSLKRGYSPEEIKQRGDVLRVEGVFRFEELRGEEIKEGEFAGWIANAEILGHIEAKLTRDLPTVHKAPDESNTCFVGAYFKPVADAKGVFYLTARKLNGRYTLLYWEGEHLPPADGGAE